MEFALLLSLIGLLGGLWIYLYGVIMSVTVRSPADPTLMALGLAHWTILCYLVLALFVFYETGVNLKSKEPLSRLGQRAERILLETWPITLVSLAVGFVITRLGEGDLWIKLPSIILGASGAIVVIYRRLRKSESGPKLQLSASVTVGFLAILALLYVPYLCVMSDLLADVQITTDKAIYSQTDTAVVSVHSAGYMFRPYIKRIGIGRFEREEYEDFTVAITPKVRNGDNLVSVDYAPQAAFWKKTAYHTIDVADTAN